jgi:hypothetical protein
VAHRFIIDGVQVNFQGHSSHGNELLHVFGVQVPGGVPASAADCAAICSVFKQWWDNVYKNMCNTGVELDQVVATALNTVPAAQHTTADGTLGTRVGAIMPPEITLAVKSTTNLSGRRNRGRQFAWPAIETDLLAPDDDQFTDGYATSILGVFNNLVLAVQTAGYRLAIKSLADGAMHPIVNYTLVDHIIDNQRRRLPGRGR